MTKVELVSSVAHMCELSKTKAEEAVNHTVDLIKKSLEEDGSFAIQGFGSFSLVNSPERNGRNPKTGEALVIPATKKITFKMSKTYKSSLNK